MLSLKAGLTNAFQAFLGLVESQATRPRSPGIDS